MEMIIQQGDITLIEADAIVNAANSSLMGGGGVDGAIHRAGGPAILEECREIVRRQGELPPGEVVLTTGGLLPAKYVIHTVGPVWRGGQKGESDILRNCYVHSLQLAEENHFRSIAFPNISTGVYGFPKEKAVQIALDVATNFSSSTVETVYFICFDNENFRLYQKYQDRIG